MSETLQRPPHAAASTTEGADRHFEPPDRAALEAVFRGRFGDLSQTGWNPRMRWKFSCFTPDEHYEATLERLVKPGVRWLDVGCGRLLLPSNKNLARELADRAGHLVGVDPDETLEENPYVHEKVRQSIDDYQCDEPFDLVTLRMVAEHVEHPEAAAETIARLVAPGGRAVIYTVYKYSPVPLITALVPFSLRHAVKAFLWRVEKKDTFPTCFRMNTRRTLRRLFAARGLEEEWFSLVDDCRSLGRFRFGQWCELMTRKLCNAVGLGYPERCILGVYRRPLDG